MMGCVVAGPVDDPEASTGSTSGSSSAATNESESATQGQSSTTSAVTGATATTTSATGPGTSTTTGADPSASTTVSGTATDSDPTEDPSASDTGGPRAQCGIEIDPAGGSYEAYCSCDTCELEWHDLDAAAFDLIVESCECLCQASGCGENSGEAVAGAEADSGGRGEASSG